ncbi:MAG TPA: biosynthetic arginine decarboxylase [Planctomycetota bacterium]|nr:biosynthetic arginine decarboxylase [Planctomycetota bacterium]
MAGWTHVDSETLYNIQNWGGGYFRVNARGHVAVYPDGGAKNGLPPESEGVDLHDLIGQLERRGLELPILLRFDGVLRSRVRELWNAFDKAREEFGYKAPFRGVYPIKVNQQRHVVEAMLQQGLKHGMGLEAGSKPELLAVLALLSGERSLVICNGYKDRAYVETALLASKLGLDPIIVVEKFTEVATIIEASRELGIRPRIGVRSKLAVSGAGRWRDSAGDRSKFGLTARQIVKVVEALGEANMLDSLVLLHFHMGSQITAIRSIKNALREGTRLLVGLREMGAPIEFFDAGGGLGIDYDGSSTNFESSVNYSLQEYANDVVYHLKEACEEAGIPEPAIVTESGRALTAHHSVLVTDVLGVTDFQTVGVPSRVGEEEPELVQNIASVSESVTAKNYQECYHDAVQQRDEAMVLFNVGQLSLAQRARVEEFFWRTCEKILRITRTMEYVPDDLANLEREMADTYFLNFSLFQSLPDSWAIGQLFPVVPLHRLDEQPQRRAVLADITCDSDGKIDRFIDLRDVKRVLELHSLKPGEPYYVGLFLIGAYQEILGDMHNLFGDTNAVHVDRGPDGKVQIQNVVRGDRVQEVLSYVEYFETDLLDRLRRSIEKAIDDDHLTFEESALLLKRYEQGLASYTYLSGTR